MGPGQILRFTDYCFRRLLTCVSSSGAVKAGVHTHLELCWTSCRLLLPTHLFFLLHSQSDVPTLLFKSEVWQQM